MRERKRRYVWDEDEYEEYYDPMTGFRIRRDEPYRSYIRDARDLRARGGGIELKLFTVGFILALIGMFLVMLSPLVGGLTGTTSGAVVFVGFPFLLPIGVAWGPHGKLLGTIGAIIALVMLLIGWLLLRRMRI